MKLKKNETLVPDGRGLWPIKYEEISTTVGPAVQINDVTFGYLDKSDPVKAKALEYAHAKVTRITQTRDQAAITHQAVFCNLYCTADCVLKDAILARIAAEASN